MLLSFLFKISKSFNGFRVKPKSFKMFLHATSDHLALLQLRLLMWLGWLGRLRFLIRRVQIFPGGFRQSSRDFMLPGPCFQGFVGLGDSASH